MGTVQDIMDGPLNEVQDVRRAMERVLSVIGCEVHAEKRMIHPDGTLTCTLTVSAIEGWRDPDEVTFGYIQDPQGYVNLRNVLHEAWLDFPCLESQGVIEPAGSLTHELEVFRAKMAAYLKQLDD
jgi:hypothetical protein